MPKIGSREAPDLTKYGVLDYTHALWGMFIGYQAETGVGVVLPVEQIRETLEHQEIKSMRDENDERVAKKRR